MLVAAIADTRRWFWDDPERQRRERVNMLGAWQHIVEFALERLGQSPAGLAAAIARDYAGRRREMMRLFPDALGCLTELRRRGVPLALVTNGDAVQQRDKIERHGLAHYLRHDRDRGRVRRGQARLGGVPAVAPRRSAWRRREAWMVGDHLVWDVDAPQQLGLRGVWVDRGGRGLPPDSAVRPHRIIRSLDELIAPGG